MTSQTTDCLYADESFCAENSIYNTTHDWLMGYGIIVDSGKIAKKNVFSIEY